MNSTCSNLENSRKSPALNCDLENPLGLVMGRFIHNMKYLNKQHIPFLKSSTQMVKETTRKKEQVIFKNLRSLLFNLFSYLDLIESDFYALNKNEKSILTFIFKIKKYSNLEKLKQIIRGNFFIRGVWFKFQKLRRKEENLKFSFRFSTCFIQNDFYLKHPKLVKNKDENEKQLLFYLFHFAKLQPVMNKKKLINTFLLEKSKNILNPEDYWSSVNSFIFPEKISKCPHSVVNSISKRFLLQLSTSDSFSKQFTKILLSACFFMGFCIDMNWEGFHFESSLGKDAIINIGIRVLRSVVRQNHQDLNKMFDEWKFKFKHQKKMENLEHLIKKGIKRKNFTFPWTFKEVHLSFLEGFVAFAEIFKANFFKLSQKGTHFFIM